MIDRATIEKIKDAADIVDVVSDYVHLVRRGGNYMGLCPFHNERTPSFSVNRNRNFCYCFSCHKGGSPINFIMEKEGISYPEALRHLAKKYGIKIEEEELTDEERERQTKREGMFMANEWAMQTMESNLMNTDEGRDIGLTYLYNRGVTAEAISEFHLGYAIDSGNSLSGEARKRGFELEPLHELGLLGKSEQGRFYDRFRGRVIFPILNTSGKPIAFGGRDLKGAAAKYINSPESELYKKNRELYGIYQARQEIGRKDRCYLVEGYLDVIGMWQSGIKNVVASSGTALTDNQIALIKRFTDNVTLIYDGDAAGIKAALRGSDMLLRQGMNLSVLLLPDGHDPDSFAKEKTPEELKEYIEKNQTDFIRFQARVMLNDAGNNPQKRSEVVHSVVESIANIPDRIKRDIYIQECSRLLNVSEEAVAEAVASAIKTFEQARIKEEMRRQRIEGEKRENSNTSQPASESSHSNPSGYPETGATATQPEPATTHDVLDKNRMTALYPLYPFEKRVMEYCIRYGFMDFCEAVAQTEDSNDGTQQEQNVILNIVEYVQSELYLDGMTFTVPEYRHIFELLLEMISDFRNAAVRERERLAENTSEKRKKGIEAIADMNLDMRRIESEERILESRLEKEEKEEFLEFTRSYPSRQLLDHEEKYVRDIALTAIRERHRLSNIYSREHPAEKEEDKLDIYVPRAITELKHGSFDLRMNALMQEFKEICGKGDAAREKEIQQELLTMMRIRSEVAKDIGDRIICPRHP